MATAAEAARIAVGAIDGATKGADCADQTFEHGIEDGLCLLRVAVGDDLQRPPDVGKQQGDVFAFGIQHGRRR
jgi:hypothetical protein